MPIFEQYLAGRGRAVTDIATASCLPTLAELRALADRCGAAEMEAARVGKQFEVKRLHVLARQLDALAQKCPSEGAEINAWGARVQLHPPALKGH